jgi:hypothetical protein
MKVMMRSILRVVHGKMEEAMELEKKRKAIANRVLGISPRIYIPYSGGGDTMRTIVVEAEFDSLTVLESLPEKIGADPEMLELFPKMASVIEGVEIEMYTPVH